MKKNGNNSISVKDMLLEMRKDRMGLIQTPDQLRFSYLAIIEGISRDWDSINDNEPLDEDENQNWPPKEVDTSSDSSDDDEPPPLPPPRGESLTTRAQGEVVAELPLQVPPTPPDRPLPSEPPTPDGQPGSPTSPNSESEKRFVLQSTVVTTMVSNTKIGHQSRTIKDELPGHPHPSVSRRPPPPNRTPRAGVAAQGEGGAHCGVLAQMAPQSRQTLSPDLSFGPDGLKNPQAVDPTRHRDLTAFYSDISPFFR
ncbi:unnamed protein product, partial [Nesidiocoris tenuis]